MKEGGIIFQRKTGTQMTKGDWMLGRGTSWCPPPWLQGSVLIKEAISVDLTGLREDRAAYTNSERPGILTWFMSPTNVLDCLHSLLGLNLEFKSNVIWMKKNMTLWAISKRTSKEPLVNKLCCS